MTNIPSLLSLISDVHTDFLLNDCLCERLTQLCEKFSITILRTPINSSEQLGNYYLPWYPSGNWSNDELNYTVANYPNRIKLLGGRPINILTLHDTSINETLIIDGCHRAVALFQSCKHKGGDLIILSSPNARILDIKDFINIERLHLKSA